MRLTEQSFFVTEAPGRADMWSVSRALRICYASRPSTDYGIEQQFVMSKIHHLSCFEEAYLSVEFEVERAIADQLRTHRHMSCKMQSTRFCNYSKEKFGSELTFIEPVGPNAGCKLSAYSRAERDYMELIDAGERPESARDVLPLGVATAFRMHGNVAAWFHVFEVRCADDAQTKGIMRKLLLELSVYPGEKYGFCRAIFRKLMDSLEPTWIS